MLIMDESLYKLICHQNYIQYGTYDVQGRTAKLPNHTGETLCPDTVSHLSIDVEAKWK